ncbi:caspase family protein [Variovorax rhizosphaerae]|uniref:Caspase family protein n=1 Tax=Variovorax rhizosphaerae TaxID=1836200 RepID=A0ABU8WX15_9BURK
MPVRVPYRAPSVRPARPIRWLRSLTLVGAASALVLSAAEAQAPKHVRVALVIGNAAYVVAPLLNSLNDARAMGRALRDLGFEVIEVNDASREQMTAGIESARRALKGKQGVAMFYYAGHGLQLDWRNYMIPVDANLAKADDVPTQAVDVEHVMAAFKDSGTRMNIVVLDACRDNPFAATASGKGLAPLDAPPGTFLAYATAPGNVALDGSEASGHGLYTQHLIAELKMPETRIEDVFKRVRTQVRKQSRGRQIPWESTSLEEDFYFHRPTVTVVSKPLDPGSLEALAQQRTEFDAEKADWDRIRESRNPEDFYAFLAAHPTGYISEQAQYRLDQLQAPVIEPQPGKNEVVALKSGARRYEVGDELTFERHDRLSFTKKTVVERVVSADDLKVVFASGQILDQMGGIIQSRFGRKDPASVISPADIGVGRKWRSAYKNTDDRGVITHHFWDAHVVRMEEITVPAGRFTAYRVEGKGYLTNASGARTGGGTWWVDPKTMYSIKTELGLFAGGKRVVDETDTLVSMNRAAR